MHPHRVNLIRMHQLAHQNAIGLISQEARHTDVLPKTGMAKIGRRMQTQQKEAQINQKDRHGNSSYWSLNCNQSYHSKLGAPSINKETHQTHLDRCYVGRTDNATGKTDADIPQSRWHGCLHTFPKSFFFHKFLTNHSFSNCFSNSHSKHYYNIFVK